MLNVTINPTNFDCSINGPANNSSLDDEMEPLFDNDWLHENNLDILFDLFEEEMERKGLDVDSSNSSAIFGTSPVTSYLFGTSPSLASALDLYDLLCFDNQQQPVSSSSPTISSNPTTSSNAEANSLINTIQKTTPNAPITATISSTTNSQANSNIITNTYNINGTGNSSCSFGTQQVSRDVSTNHIASSISNAMRIKRRVKKGQSEGISLLARPVASNSSSGNGSGGICSSSCNGNISIINKNNSDKTSTKITNLKNSIIANRCVSKGVDINDHNRQRHHNRNKHHHHAHYITGCAVIREHAYAVRGH